MSSPQTCPHESTIDDIREDVRKLTTMVEKWDEVIRGDGDQKVGVAGRLNALEAMADTISEAKKIGIGAIVVGVLSFVGGLVLVGFKAFTGGHQ